jgi:hypothetical protein
MASTINFDRMPQQSKQLSFPFVLYWNQSGRQVGQPGYIELVQNLNGFTIKNIGTTICVLNDDPIQPGESKSFGGNWGEIYVGRVYVRFVTQTPPPSTITNLLFLTEKFYVSAPNQEPDNVDPLLGL